MNRILCIWLPNWPLQRLYLSRPRFKEVVLYEKGRGDRVVACSGRHGIRLGMTRAEASALADVRFEEHDPVASRGALLKLVSWCEQFSPCVGMEGTDNLCLDVTGLAHLFGSEERLARRVKQEFQRLQLKVRLAIADTLGAAWAVAHYGREGVVPPGAIEALMDLPLAALRITALEVLTELGILQIGQLLALHRETIAARFDAELLLRLDQATGRVPEPIVSHRPTPSIVAEKRLEYPTGNRQVLEAILQELIKSVCHSLNQRRQGAIQLECTLSCESAEPIKLLIGVYRATADAKHLLELAVMQLDRQLLPGSLLGVRLSVLISASLESRQQELFEESDRDDRRQVDLLVNRISSRLGRHNVARAIFRAEAQPELAVDYEPLVGIRPRKRKDYPPQRLTRPLRLYRKPFLIQMFTTFPDGAPGQFDWQGRHRVADAWGPERIQTGWWRDRYVQRDYYRVETTSGKRFWLFRRLSDSNWFLHGVFD